VIVYIAGPLTTGAINLDGTLDMLAVSGNVHRAEKQLLEVAKLGHAPICPHSMYRHMFGTLPERVWLALDLALLERCDAMVLSQGHASFRSSGTRNEVRRFALELRRPVYAFASDLPHGFAMTEQNILNLLHEHEGDL
jgi:hypothetical protein